tara:strand:+ start:725 stop:1423 length:699 start_codon:yes stop_codon:yes gene_type:complete
MNTLNKLKFHFVKKSGNKKTGFMPVTYNSRLTCPDSCIFKNNGCYADNYHTALNWDKVTRGDRGGSFKELLNNIKALKPGTIWRACVAGDIPNNNKGEISRTYIKGITEANQGLKGYTYTHNRLDIGENISLLKTANKQGFTVNISSETEAAADNAILNNLPAVMVVKSTETRNSWTTKGGNRVLVCLAQTASKSCIDCKLCQDRPSPKLIIAFKAHGNQAKKIDSILDNLN